MMSPKLLAWSAKHPREMPWKGEKNPYKVWLSEIILQQTRVEQGLPYYEKFLRHYPTIRHLADASEDAVLKDWEGLGYYTRARNLHATAKYIAYSLNGHFPDTYAGIRSLKGVGDYTAAAIASFAFDLPYSVLDGNVYRVLARKFGIETPVDTPAAKRQFADLAQALLDKTQPAAYNQAMMDFGATHCTPANPACTTCPFQEECVAFASNQVEYLPVKSKKMIKKERYFLYVIFKKDGEIWVQQRTEKDIWQNLYEFPMIELETLPDGKSAAWEIVLKQYFSESTNVKTPALSLSKTFRQTLTHQHIYANFLSVDLADDFSTDIFSKTVYPAWKRVFLSDFKENFSVPRIIHLFFSNTSFTFAD